MKAILLSISFCILLLASCQDASKSTSASENLKDTSQNQKVEMRDYSPLSTEMLNMEQQMKWVRQKIKKDESWSSEVFIDFHSIDTLQASDHINIGKDYHRFTDSFMNRYNTLMYEKQTQQQFEKVINTCISCHQNYCQGPISKIKRLLP